MNAQLETQIDTEVTDMAEEIGGILEAAFDVLIQRRDRQFAAAVEPLDAEEESLRDESASIHEARRNLEKLLPAREREAQRQADALLLAGEHKAAQVKLTEAEDAANAPAAMTDRQREISARIEAIEAEKQAAARKIFESWYPDDQRIIRAAEHGLFVTLLNGVEDAMTNYEARAGKGETLIKLFHRTNLTAPERSPEWQAGYRWYGGGR